MKRFVLFVLVACATSGVFAQDTTSVLGGGVCINEFLVDPNSATFNFDTDASGMALGDDEFVELYNLSASPVDISGWQVWDPGSGGNWFTFPASTTLQPDSYAVVIYKIQAGGALPVVTAPNLSFEGTGPDTMGNGAITNTGDGVFVYDPNNDEFIHAFFNGDGADDFNAISGTSGTATQVGTSEDFGSDTDGASLTRFPAGDIAVISTETINSNMTASPGTEAAMGLDDPDALVNTMVDFGPAGVGGSASATLTVTNNATSTMDLSVSAFAYSSGDMVFSVTGGVPATIMPGDSADISLSFNPAGAGAASAVFSLASNDQSNPSIDVTLTGEGVSFTDVADVAGARALADLTFARIAGPITVSVNPGDYSSFGGNTAFPGQDATGGLLLFYPSGSGLVSGGAGTSLSNVEGQVVVFNDTIEFEILNVGSEAPGTPITPEIVTATALVGPPIDVFESELVSLENVSLTADAGGTGNWETGTNYVFQDAGLNMFTVRFAGSGSNLRGTALPALATPVTLTGIGTEFGGAGQLSPVDPSDLSAPAAAGDWAMFE